MSSLELRDLTREIATEAATLARTRRAEGVSIAASKSSPEDVVTAADREVEAFIRSRIAELRPRDGFFGEESGAEAGSSGLTWVVDPIDGTVNYLYGIPNYAVSIGVVEGEADPATWRALAGTVINAATGELSCAALGAGAWNDGKPMYREASVEVPLALVSTGFSYSASRRVWQTGIMQQMMGRVRDYRRMGAAALDLVSVPQGRSDAYYEVGTKPWDHAAGVLIAREAGMRVEGIRGAAPGADLVLAAVPGLFEPIHDLLCEFGIDNPEG